VSELVDYPSWRPSPRRPDDRQTQALKDTEKTAIDSFEATVARSIYDTVVNGPAEFTGRRQYLPDGETPSIAEEVSEWHRNAQNNSS